MLKAWECPVWMHCKGIDNRQHGQQHVCRLVLTCQVVAWVDSTCALKQSSSADVCCTAYM